MVSVGIPSVFDVVVIGDDTTCHVDHSRTMHTAHTTLIKRDLTLI